MEAAANSTLPVINVFTVDAYGQRLGAFDVRHRKVDVHIRSGDGTGRGQDAALMRASTTMWAGATAFGNVVLALPKVSSVLASSKGMRV